MHSSHAHLSRRIRHSSSPPLSLRLAGVYYTVWPLCVALVITIWCSIFQASFFAYVNSPEGRDIEQILYFVRLFSDLLGRPLTRMCRPPFLRVRRAPPLHFRLLALLRLA